MAGVRALVAYGSWRARGATHAIASWVAEELRARGFDVEVARASEVGVKRVDLLVAGSAVYFETPVRSVLSLLRRVSAPTAVFVVCVAARLGRWGVGYARRRYIRRLEEAASGELVGSEVFRGWLFRPLEGERGRCVRWAREVAERVLRG